MILVDSSIWIEFIRRPNSIPRDNDLFLISVTCGPILQEVIQGIHPGPQVSQLRDALLSVPRLCDPVPTGMFLSAANIYREGRSRGITIRSSVDCLIAAIAIENNAIVWHRDRDFDKIARYTSLRATTRI